MKNRLGIVLALNLLLSGTVFAELQVETTSTAKLSEPTPHWMWVSDLMFSAMEGGKAFLVDGDSGQMKGMLSTGYFFASALQDSGYKTIYSPEVYLSRGTRGERTDIIAIYDPLTLTAVDEIIIPPKHFSGVPIIGHAAISGDDRFIAVFNFTPAQSVSIVDAKARKFLHEVETPGCAEVFAAGDRAFNMICGDGSMLTLMLDDDGEVETARSDKFFDPKTDIIDDKMAQNGDVWAFFTRSGKVRMIDMSGGKPEFMPLWSLFSEGQRADQWMTGGYQYATINQSSNELYVLVHRGDKFTHKYPGMDVWVYDLETKERVRQISLSAPALSIQVTPDDKPLLFTADLEHPGLHVYDANTGEHRHHVEDLAVNPTLFWQVHP